MKLEDHSRTELLDRLAEADPAQAKKGQGKEDLIRELRDRGVDG